MSSSKKAESRMPESREGPRYSGDFLLDSIDVPLYAVDAAGRCIRINRASEQLLGYSQAEMLGQDMHQMVHYQRPNLQPLPAHECALVQARNAQAPVQGLEEVLWSKGGEPVAVECSSAPVTLEDGSTGAVVTMKDLRGRVDAQRHLQAVVLEQLETIRQRDAAARVASDFAAEEVARQRQVQAAVERAATDQIREQQHLLGTVAETAPVGIAVFDHAMRYRWTNECFARSLDPSFRSVSLPGTSFFDTVPEANVEELRLIVAEVQTTGRAYSSEAYALQGVRRGTTYWQWSLTRLDNGDLMSTAVEVTEQVHARREIEAVYANAPIALSLIHAETLRYVRVNVRYAGLFHVTPEAMWNQRVGTFSSSKHTEEILAATCAGQPVVNRLLQLELLSDPGTERFLLINAFPNLADTGKVETISLAITDVTAQKRAEDALVQADKLAAVGRLAASISHEINNPLEAVTNLLYLVHQDPALSAESCAYIEQAEQELSRVSHIASQTLRFQRHAVKPVEVTARQLVDPVVALYRGRLKHTRIEVSVEYRGETDSVRVFEGDVRQILNNLLGNAIDALHGGGKITIRAKPARCVHTHRRGTRISIADTGHGMSAETAAHIFEPFFTTKGSGGSGLGLWISHTLASRHAGSLRVRSRRAHEHPSGKGGTVFSLFLPNLDPGEKVAA